MTSAGVTSTYRPTGGFSFSIQSVLNFSIVVVISTIRGWGQAHLPLRLELITFFSGELVFYYHFYFTKPVELLLVFVYIFFLCSVGGRFCWTARRVTV